LIFPIKIVNLTTCKVDKSLLLFALNFMNLGKAEKKFAFAQASATYIAGL